MSRRRSEPYALVVVHQKHITCIEAKKDVGSTVEKPHARGKLLILKDEPDEFRHWQSKRQTTNHAAIRNNDNLRGATGAVVKGSAYEGSIIIDDSERLEPARP